MLIDKAMIYKRHISRNSHIVEIHQHLTMCKIRSQVFKGREEIIKKLKFYLTSPSCYPLVIYGLSGSGKTSVLAKCASLIKFWFPGSAPYLIIRFLGLLLILLFICICNIAMGWLALLHDLLTGTTSHSCSIRLVLYNLCWHICQIFNEDPSNIPGEYSNLVKYFHDIIQVRILFFLLKSCYLNSILFV